MDTAYAWCIGDIDDAALILSRPLIPQAIYFGDLPSRAAYRDGLRQLLYFWQRGARAVILRTGTREVIEHVCNHGARQTCFEQDTGKGRFAIGAEFVDTYCRRLAGLPRISRYLKP